MVQTEKRDNFKEYIGTQENFVKFCNIFLKTEVSRLLKAYSALGRDQGADAEYYGEYEGKSGYWVFQYKFHDPGDEQRARRSFLSAVKGGKNRKGELDKAHDLGCDHYVLMTNIALTRGNHEKLRAIKGEKGYTFSLVCWDRADLDHMTTKFPYIITPFLPASSQVFFSWQEMFKDMLSGRHMLLRYDYETFGREKEMQSFKTFLEDPDGKLLIVYGAGGIGKTKLAIEFAKTVESQYSDYEPLFIRSDVESFENHLSYVPPSRKYLFIIDNAHDFYSFYGGFRALLNSRGYEESKAVLVTRKAFKDFVKGNFLFSLSPESIQELELTSLSRERTKEFIQRYANAISEGTLNHLTVIARDTPLIAVMAIDMHQRSKDQSQLTRDQLVEAAFESYLSDIFSEHLRESGERHREMLNWFSGIQPVQIDDDQTVGALADILGLRTDQVARIQQNLIDYGLIAQYGKKLRVFPDQLGDYILRKACFLNDRLSAFHEELLEKFLPVVPTNVIKNLAKAEHMVGQGNLLDIFVNSLKDEVKRGDNQVRWKILHWIEGLCYFRPLDAIEIFRTILDNPNDNVSKVSYGIWGTVDLTHGSLIEKVAKEARKTIYTLPGFTETLGILRRLLLFQELRVGFADSPGQLLKEMASYKTAKSLVFQHKALDVFRKWVREDKPELSIPVLEAVKTLFVIEFDEIGSQSGAIVISWHTLKYTPELAALRKRATDIFSYIASSSEHIEVRKKAVECVQDAMRPPRMRAVEIPVPEPESIKPEQEGLFQILDNMIETETSLPVLNSVDQCLNYCRNYSTGFPKQRATELLDKFRNQPNFRKYAFYRQCVGQFQDWDMTSEEMEAIVRGYIGQYPPKELAQLMLECINASGKDWDYGSARFLLFTIGRIEPAYGNILLDQILSWQIEESHYASGLLNGIRLADPAMGKNETDRLLKEGGILAQRIVARSYRKTNDHIFSTGELNILDQLARINDTKLKIYLTESLPNFYAVDTDRVFYVLEHLAEDRSPRVLEEVVKVLTDRKLNFSPQKHLGTYKSMMMHYVDVPNLGTSTMMNHYIGKILGAIFTHDPLWVVEFFEQRISIKEQEPERNYEAVPHGVIHSFPDINWSDERVVFAIRKIMEWTMESPPRYKLLEAPYLLKCLVRSSVHGVNVPINATLKTLFEEWIDSGDIEHIRRVAYLMREFAEDDIFYSLVERILINSNGDEEIQDELRIAATSGGYSRGFGSPAPVHVERINYLRKLLDQTDSDIVIRFAQSMIKSTEQTIREELQRDEELVDE